MCFKTVTCTQSIHLGFALKRVVVGKDGKTVPKADLDIKATTTAGPTNGSDPASMDAGAGAGEAGAAAGAATAGAATAGAATAGAAVAGAAAGGGGVVVREEVTIPDGAKSEPRLVCKCDCVCMV